MSSLVLTDCKAWVAGYDLSGQLNAVALQHAAEMLDETTFGATTRINKAGLKRINSTLAGLWDSSSTTAIDPVVFARVGTADIPVSMSPTAGADGEVAYLFRAAKAEYSPGAQVGSLFAFNVTMEGSGGAPLVRGLVLQPASAKTSSGTGTARQLGAVSATQKIYGALHVIAASGTTPTLDVKVQSDNASNFPSATDRLTFAQQTTTGSSDWQSAAGAITDDWFRVSFTIGGTNPSFTFIVTAGIK